MDNNMILESLVQILSDDERAEAAVSTNPHFTWLKFVLTDAKPNKNKQMIPQEEFDNILRTALYAPLKMAKGEIRDGHEFSRPIGAITHLKVIDDKIIGLAALWKIEYPEDVEIIEASYKKGTPLNISWELTYKNPDFQDGVEVLRNVAIIGATLVGMPAYAGRTPVIAVASEKMEESMEEELKVEESQINGAQQEPSPDEDFRQKYEEASSKIEELQKAVAELQTRLEELLKENEGLKNKIEEENKLKQIKQMFSSAGIIKPDEFFEEKRNELLSMDSGALAFMLQEMIAFKGKTAEASVVPPITGQRKAPDKKELLQYLIKETLQK